MASIVICIILSWLTSEPGKLALSHRESAWSEGFVLGGKISPPTPLGGMQERESPGKRRKICFGLCGFLNELGPTGKAQNLGTLQRIN